jgi:hypothetical protein
MKFLHLVINDASPLNLVKACQSTKKFTCIEILCFRKMQWIMYFQDMNLKSLATLIQMKLLVQGHKLHVDTLP